MSKSFHVGWAQAILAICFFWGVSNTFLSYSIQKWDCNPIVYSCVIFTSAALGLLTFSGYGKLAKETMRSIDTWGYGISLMLNYIVILAILVLVTATELTLLQSTSAVFSLLAGWFFLSRKIDKYQALGALFISLGVIVVMKDLSSETFGVVLLLVICMSLIQTIRTYIAEFHRPHSNAHQNLFGVKDRARVVALVMFVVSTLFFFTFFGLALLMQSSVEIAIPFVPEISDFLHPPTIILGILMGLTLIAPLRYLEFNATFNISTENYLALATLAPVTTWFWEWAFSPMTKMDLSHLSMSDGIACALITAGGLVIALTRKKKKSVQTWELSLRYTSQDLEAVEDSREMIANTLEHFNGDVKRSAKALGVSPSVIEAVLSDKEKVLAFKGDVIKEVARQYRRHVALSDALTGLSNRSGFMTALKSAAYEVETYSILFIDLNKFKPVNDTYGHEAGDFILKGVAERLTESFRKDTLITRLGGDEFVVLMLKAPKDAAIKRVARLKELLAEPFIFEGQEIIIGGSVGVATYPEDARSPEALLKHADQNMYREKSER